MNPSQGQAPSDRSDSGESGVVLEPAHATPQDTKGLHPPAPPGAARVGGAWSGTVRRRLEGSVRLEAALDRRLVAALLPHEHLDLDDLP